MTVRSQFVVVANRLPVDEVTHAAGAAVAPQSRRPRHRAASGARRAPGHLGRLGRRHRRRPRAVRAGGHPAAPGAAERRGARALLRGPVQRHHLAALPRRGRDPGLQAPLVGGVPAGQRRGSPRPRRTSPAEGATVWVQDYQLQLVPAMLRELRPDLRIGFFLHIPFPPIELFMQMPLPRRDAARPARRRPGRLPAAAGGAELRPARPAPARPALRGADRSRSTAGR